jgi:hypothetical protein
MHRRARIALAGTCALLGGAVPALAGREVQTHVDVGNQIVDGTGAAQALAGRIVILTPRSWRRTSADDSPSADFVVHQGASCVARLDASPRGVATRNGPLTQARRVTRFPLAVIGEGRRPGGAWRAVEVKNPPRGPLVYGIAVVRIVPRRWVHLRIFATYAGCSEQEVRRGSTAVILRRVLRDAEMQVRVVPFRRA